MSASAAAGVRRHGNRVRSAAFVVRLLRGRWSVDVGGRRAEMLRGAVDRVVGTVRHAMHQGVPRRRELPLSSKYFHTSDSSVILIQ